MVTDNGLPRRKFLDYFLGGGLGVLLLGMAAPIGAYLWPARKRGGVQEMIDAGRVSELPVGSGKAFQVGGHPILLVRAGETEFRAFSSACPHLGCIVHWDGPSREFKCPCHAGVFSADGKVVSGPPPSALIAYQVTVTGDQIKIKVPPA
ncbi:Rieske (2Fe-2S) protein [bacterium]|nr:Rieske (2Fe-2S) protein [bacterium]